MTTLQFCLSVAALLVAPGPTNALLALSGAEAGTWRTLRLLPLVIAAYAITVLPLSMLGDGLYHQQHWVRGGMTFVAGLWVAWMAVVLWRRPQGQAANVTPHRGLRLFITTLLNPKAFIIGLVLIPSQATHGYAIALFIAVLTVAAILWAMLGAALHHAGGTEALPLLRRVCAAWLGLLAVLLGSAALSV